MNLSKVSTIELIHELKQRDISELLSEGKRQWLEDNGFVDISNMHFMNLKRKGNGLFSADYLRNHSLEEIIAKDEKLGGNK